MSNLPVLLGTLPRAAGVLIAAALTLRAIGLIAGPQTAPPSLRLRVLDGTTNEPMEGANVYLRCFDRYPAIDGKFIGEFQGTTDARGEFVFASLDSGTCLPLGFGRPPWRGRGMDEFRPYEVAPGETLRIVHVWKWSNIEGTVLDERNQPIAKTPVRLASFNPLAGRITSGRTALMTDDRGVFHLGPIPAWICSAERPCTFTLDNVELTAPAPSIVLQHGESRRVELRGRRQLLFNVSGQVADGSGVPVDVALYLETADSPEGFPVMVATVYSDRQGRFRFPDVPRGAYRIRVDTNAPGSGAPGGLLTTSLWAKVPVTVTANVENLSIPVRPTPTIRGSLRYEGRSPAPDASALRLSFRSMDGPGESRFEPFAFNPPVADGRFQTAGLKPGRYVIDATAPGWRLHSAVSGGRDLSVTPFEFTATSAIDDLVVTLTDRRTSITGIVQTAADSKADAEATVIVFSTDQQAWSARLVPGRRVRAGLTNQLGKYAVIDLLPGEYFIVAIPSTETPDAPEGLPAELIPRLVPLATRIRVEYDAPLTVNLQRVSIR